MKTELDLRQLLVIIGRKLWFVILVTVVVGGAVFAYSRYRIVPQYTATASLYVYNESARSEDITSADLTTSQKLVETYIVILKSNSVLEEVSGKLGNQYSADAIRHMLSASAINNTEAFQVSITNPDREVAQRITNTIIEIAPKEIKRVVKAGSVEVIDSAKLPASPSSPDIPKNTAIGALLGLVLSVAVVVLRSMFDTVVHSEEELIAAFTIPIIGVIPSIDGDDKSGGRIN